MMSDAAARLTRLAACSDCSCSAGTSSASCSTSAGSAGNSASPEESAGSSGTVVCAASATSVSAAGSAATSSASADTGRSVNTMHSTRARLKSLFFKKYPSFPYTAIITPIIITSNTSIIHLKQKHCYILWNSSANTFSSSTSNNSRNLAFVSTEYFFFSESE